MSKRVDEREPTRVNLECYNKLLKLSSHTLSVCKPKEKNTNNKHIPKRLVSVGHMLIDLVIDIGADIMEANDIFVGNNVDENVRNKNLRRRIELQEKAISKTYRMEHIINMLEYEFEFADSTLTYWVELLLETRNLTIKWKDSDRKKLGV